MNILENLKKINLTDALKEKTFQHAVFVREEASSERIRFWFALPEIAQPVTIDVQVIKGCTIQLMTGTINPHLLDEIDGKIEDVLEWLHTTIKTHALFRLPLVTNAVQFKFVKVRGNITYQHQLAFLTEK